MDASTECGDLPDTMNNDSFLIALGRMGLLQPGESPPVTPLTGGVSSDIVRVDLSSGSICVKRALARLKVEAEWQAPVERNQYEIEWMRIAASVNPRAVPKLLGEDRETGMFAMEFLDSVRYPVWKTQLRDGDISLATAREVGRRIAAIHGYTAGGLDVAQRFPTDHIFFPIRLEPYLCATAKKHPDCAGPLASLVRMTSATKKTLVHGDISPKNILVGPDGPVFLDAECAWYGDPAFDLAFCLNHLLLKCLWVPGAADDFLLSFQTLFDAYSTKLSWERTETLETRTASLLPALLLARVDGKSPVEYLVSESEKEHVRTVARELLLRPVASVSSIGKAWQGSLK